MFRTFRYADVSATRWMADLPPRVMSQTLDVPRSVVAALPKDEQTVV